MNLLPFRSAALALALAAAGLSAHAASSASSASSEGSSASSGSVSDSIEGSSNSSSKKDKVAAGDYKVIEVAEVAERPGVLRMTLQPVAEGTDAERFNLYLPAAALAQAPVVAGQIVSARTRPYGYEFAQADTGRPFYLVLHDAWVRELQSNAVAL
ncbi:MAG TPA: hypothetical protein VFL64_18590 [Rhizobacter sp.]|nr:hypothetical protein [Rhizobacter sp.]